MIKFSRHTLDNGLRLLVHHDPTTPMAVVNTLYMVGARDEDPNRTGFAHLFEHLMFGGSANAPSFDTPLERAGGESNAFTNNDYTNYYNVVPANNIETALWLESDRMLDLNINERSLDIQRKVVCEEFRENYINQPYGDVWHTLSSLAYKRHPYRWPTIGLELSHIEEASLDDVQAFYNNFYRPSNAIMVISGPLEFEEVVALIEKWFSDIPGAEVQRRTIENETLPDSPRHKEVHANVPVPAIYKAWLTGARNSRNYYVMDLVTDILGSGNSARLYQKLVKEQELFSEVDAYVTGSLDNGLVILEGKLSEGVSMEQADQALSIELERMRTELVGERELTKIKNKMETYQAFSSVNILNRSINLSYYEMLGDADAVNTDISHYLSITPEEILEHSSKTFDPSISNTLYYHANGAN